jgi:hypothetical protein
VSTGFLELAACRVALGLLGSDDLARVGAQALALGCESPSLRILAGLPMIQVDEARAAFDRALAELNISMPNERAAIMRLAREAARGIVSGAISAYVGAKRIWDFTLCAPREELPELDAFVYAASEWEDRPEDRQAFEQGILAAAERLTRN